ncbi:MAG: hypothetical protein U5K76_11210 [Woeseiaceae bacterium]|nr:hypothetical protein [Woeseiaceae bacterium]
MATVNATRAASDDELLQGAGRRLAAMIGEGVATVEIKSGYGLDLDTELRLLRLARRLGRNFGITVRTTFLGAHAVPAEHRDDPDAYVDFVCDEVLPAVQAEGLADAVDAYCRMHCLHGGAGRARVRRGEPLRPCPVKLHADQLCDGGGAALAARYGALSADHVEYTGEDGIRALAAAGSVAVLLPGAYVTLRETQRAARRTAAPPRRAARARRPTATRAPRRSARCSP